VPAKFSRNLKLWSASMRAIVNTLPVHDSNGIHHDIFISKRYIYLYMCVFVKLMYPLKLTNNSIIFIVVTRRIL
jgi:hypothetical protein